ncbi:hypothetical protein L1987_53563 [Smallanthus sonchifolius]|uniref:Uncharacterized protein n=1 Tax=Smallanthus sonchifolius TaxID=185202 RepID=A0ACB9EX09_9ASTR|nr:hypothetical protein L1987_53563 [Smallanthus sonchifolius]
MQLKRNLAAQRKNILKSNLQLTILHVRFARYSALQSYMFLAFNCLNEQQGKMEKLDGLISYLIYSINKNSFIAAPSSGTIYSCMTLNVGIRVGDIEAFLASLILQQRKKVASDFLK